jgi:hypothetical protein
MVSTDTLTTEEVMMEGMLLDQSGNHLGMISNSTSNGPVINGADNSSTTNSTDPTDLQKLTMRSK